MKQPLHNFSILKPFSSSRYLNYNSSSPNNQKLNIIIEFIDRVISFPLPEYDNDNLEKIDTFLLNHDYLLNLIQRIEMQLKSQEY